MLLTFLDKPFAGKNGSGMHLNFSLVDANGNNAHIGTSSDDGISALARQCVAGIVAQHEGLTGLLAPTVVQASATFQLAGTGPTGDTIIGSPRFASPRSVTAPLGSGSGPPAGRPIPTPRRPLCFKQPAWV